MKFASVHFPAIPVLSVCGWVASMRRAFAQFYQHTFVKKPFYCIRFHLPGANLPIVALEKAKERTLVQFVVQHLHDGATSQLTNPVTGMKSSLCHCSLGYLKVDN